MVLATRAPFKGIKNMTCFVFAKKAFFNNPSFCLVKSRLLGILDPNFKHIVAIFFMYFADLDFYTKTTDVEFYLQITALSGPQACLGHLNPPEKSLIVYQK